MVVESDTALIAVFVACVMALVAATVVFMLFLSAGLTVLRAKGYGRSAGWWGFVSVAGPPALVFTALVVFFVGGPSPPRDVMPVVGSFGAFLLALPGACFYWLVARTVPKRERVDRSRRRRFPYGVVGTVVGVAVAPAAALLWWLDGWDSALRILVLGVSVASLLRYWERRYRNQLPARPDRGPDVLYLRGFTHDSRTTLKAKEKETRWAAGPVRGWVNLEQFLADEIERRVGDFVAPGDPRDILPPGGGRRTYLSEDWKNEVRILVKAARAILMPPDVSASLQTELKIIKEEKRHTRLFVVTAPAGRSSGFWRWWWGCYSLLCGWRETPWPDFAMQLKKVELQQVDDDPGPGAVITFDSAGRRIDLARGCTGPQQFVEAIAARLTVLEDS